MALGAWLLLFPSTPSPAGPVVTAGGFRAFDFLGAGASTSAFGDAPAPFRFSIPSAIPHAFGDVPVAVEIPYHGGARPNR